MSAVAPAPDATTVTPYLSRRAASKYTTYSERTLQDAKDLPVIRVGRSIRYRREDLDAWMESKIVRPASAKPIPTSRGREVIASALAKLG